MTNKFLTNPFAISWRNKLRLLRKPKVEVCDRCDGEGVIMKTEWHEDENSEFSYDVPVRCVCQED